MPEEDESEEEHSIKLEDNQIKAEAQCKEGNDGQGVGSEGVASMQVIGSKKRIHRKSDISNFIMKTYKILEDRANAYAIEWTDEGNCFIVRNKELFENDILPKYFKHRKFSSFVRQLNMYDFHKIRKEKEIPIFKHKYFKMGHKQLLFHIKRKAGEELREEDPEHPSIPGLHNEIPVVSSHSIPKVKGSSLSAEAEIELLNNQNQELKHCVLQLGKEIKSLELNRELKKEKLIKILSCLIFFDLKPSSYVPGQNIRSLQNHFLSDEEPLSFSDYTNYLAGIYNTLQARH